MIDSRYVKVLVFIFLISFRILAMSSRPVYVTPSDKYYIVKHGDTLSHISKKSGISVKELKLINNLKSDKIFVGQKIFYKPQDPIKRNLYVTERRIPYSKKHTVNKGESLTTIAKMYGLDLLDLLHYNHIVDWVLKEGEEINLAAGMLPKAAKQTKKQTSKPVKTKKKSDNFKNTPQVSKQKKQAIKDTEFISPLKNYSISQKFNRDQRHQGIDLAADAGTPVFAAKTGTVIYAGNQKGYGNLIIIEHPERIMTVYAHNEKNIVEAGDCIEQGQQIATVGNSGRTSGNHLHFEIRREGIAVNPQEYISSLGS